MAIAVEQVGGGVISVLAHALWAIVVGPLQILHAVGLLYMYMHVRTIDKN